MSPIPRKSPFVLLPHDCSSLVFDRILAFPFLRLIVIFRSLFRLPRLAGFTGFTGFTGLTRFARLPVLVLSASTTILVTAHASVGDLTLQLLNLTLLLGLGVGLLLTHDAKDVLQSCPPVINSVGQLLVLLLAEDTVCNLVNEELLALLGELALDKTGTDHVNGPHLDLVLGDLQSLGDLGVFDFAARRGGGQAGKCQKAHLAVELLVVQLLLLNPTLVLIIEIVVVLEILFSKDIEKLRVDGVGVAEGLHAGNAPKILEKEMVVGGESLLNRAKGKSLGVLGGDGIAVECSKGLNNVLVGLSINSLVSGTAK
jgi:hypothetical protein